jgi:SulP family sulfate permease
VARHAELPRREDVVVVCVESGLFFGNADHVREETRDLVTPSTVRVVTDSEATPFIDVSAIASC